MIAKKNVLPLTTDKNAYESNEEGQLSSKIVKNGVELFAYESQPHIASFFRMGSNFKFYGR
jgi:hypothetical protein